MKKKLTLTLVVLTISVIAVAFTVFTPLRKPKEEIRAVLLQATPIGMVASDVRSVVDKKSWLDREYAGTTGFLKQEVGKETKIVGVTSIRGHLGSYREFPIPLRTDVTAFWGFDGERRLVDVWVWKTTDAP